MDWYRPRFEETDECPKCGSKDVSNEEQLVNKNLKSTYFVCHNCGYQSQGYSK